MLRARIATKVIHSRTSFPVILEVLNSGHWKEGGREKIQVHMILHKTFVERLGAWRIALEMLSRRNTVRKSTRSQDQ
jgi:hypothetical protein